MGEIDHQVGDWSMLNGEQNFSGTITKKDQNPAWEEHTLTLLCLIGVIMFGVLVSTFASMGQRIF